MQISVSQIEYAKYITVESRTLATGNLREFRDLILPEIEGQEKVYLDLNQVTFVDSAGLGALISCLRVCGNESCEMVLTGLNRNVKTLFELMRVERLFKIEELEVAR